MAATAEVAATNQAATEQAPVAPAVKAVPAPKAEPAKPAAEAKEKPKAPTAAAAPKDAREANIAKFAKAMNADAEKDGVQVDAPPEHVRAKPGPKPGAKREPAKPAPEAPAPKPKATVLSDEDTGHDVPNDAAEAGADADEDADTGKPEPRATHQLKAKARLRHGDVDKAIRLAFGDMKPEEFEGAKEALAKKLGVGSKQWADFRRYEQQERAKTRQLEQNATQLSQRLQAEFQPMLDARKAYAAKDYPKAFELAFGEDVNDFSRKAIHQKLSVDPEKTRLQQELAEIRNELKSLRGGAAQPQAASPEQTQAAAMQREGERTHQALVSQTDDPEIAHFAKRAAFVRRVVEIRGEHYDPTTRTTIPLNVAADMARDEVKQGLSEWHYDASGAAVPSPETPGLAGNEPVRTSPRARSPNPSLAAQAGGSTRSMTREERIKAFAARM